MKSIASQPEGLNKLQYIDCLRGIAILMVILNHADWHLPQMNWYVQALSNYGQMGVQLFFVASAFTLCLSMERRKSDETLKSFYARRYFRIAPLYYLGIPLYLFYHSFIEPVMEGKAMGIAEWYNLPNILANVFLVNDFVPGDANTRVVPGGWSIGTETTFYALFPFIFLLYKKYGKSDRMLFLLPLTGLLLSYAGIVALEFVAVDMVGYSNFFYFKENGFLYFSLLCQLPVFLLGMSLYFKVQNLQLQKMDQYFMVLAFIAFTLLAIIVQIHYEGLIYIKPFLPAVSFFFLFLLYKEIPQLSSRLLARIGQLSYSIYLFHFMFAFEGSRILQQLLAPFISIELIFALTALLTTIVSAGVAVLSEKYIEKPGIELGKKVIAKIKTKKRKTTEMATLKTDAA